MPNQDPQEEYAPLPRMQSDELRSSLAAQETPAEPDLAISLEDVTTRVDEINVPAQIAAQQQRVANPEALELPSEAAKIIAYREKLAQGAKDAEAAWSRSSEKKVGESDKDHQERIKKAFHDAVLAARNQAAMPPPPTMPVPTAIAEQTRREMEAGRKQSEYWKEQQKQRPLPTAKEIQAAGSNTQVFRPGEYAHEKGGVDKNLVTQNTPGR